MSAQMTGVLFGALLGIVSFGVIRWGAARVEQGDDPKQRQAVGLMRAAATADLLLFPVIGYFVGPMVLG